MTVVSALVTRVPPSLCSRCGARAPAALSHIPQLLECVSDLCSAASASASHSGKYLSRAVAGGRRCSARSRERSCALQHEHDSSECHFNARALVCRRLTADSDSASHSVSMVRLSRIPACASAAADATAAAAADVPATRLAALEHDACDAPAGSARGCTRARPQSHALCAVALRAPADAAAIRASRKQQRPS